MASTNETNSHIPPLKKKKLNDDNTEENIISISDDSDDEMPPLIAMIDSETNIVSNNTTDHSIKKELVILSWNIDGLDERELELRVFLGIADKIRIHSPDVVLLQEVVFENLAALQKNCRNYEFIVHSVTSYFNVIMVKKNKSIIIGEHSNFVFEKSTMGRFLLIQELKINGTSFHIMTTHLESCAEAAEVRKDQLQLCFEKMKNFAEQSNVILSGDLNIREKEIKALKGPPDGISDAWIMCGSDSKLRFTWDLQLNDNKSFGSTKPRARYDRMYYSSLQDKEIKCLSFELVGKERIEACGLFPSDHFGLLVKFSL